MAKKAPKVPKKSLKVKKGFAGAFQLKTAKGKKPLPFSKKKK